LSEQQIKGKLPKKVTAAPAQRIFGKSQVSEVLDVAMMPSLVRKDEVVDLVAIYGQIIVDDAIAGGHSHLSECCPRLRQNT
jgi:hypothetical protein